MEAVRYHERTGRPLGGEKFVDKIEKALGRMLHRQKPGPKQRTNN
jgi:putative transposase